MRKLLPNIICISDEDMDPKNVMWENGKPSVIDLECLEYGNPISHVLQLSLQWSGTTICDINLDYIQAFFDGYLEVKNTLRRIRYLYDNEANIKLKLLSLQHKCILRR